MDMSKEAITKILSLAPVEEKEFDGIKYTSKQLHRISPPIPNRLIVNTLTGLEDYCNMFSAFESINPLVHIVAHDEVTLVSKLDKIYRNREEYIMALCQYAPFPFGKELGVEEFIIALQSRFVANETSKAIMKLVGNLSNESVSTLVDDGTTQMAQAKTGIVTIEDVKVPNPVELKPYRTFADIDQPASNFIFRLKSNNRGITCALYEADGDAWKLQAIENIKKRLAGTLPESIKIIG